MAQESEVGWFWSCIIYLMR